MNSNSSSFIMKYQFLPALFIFLIASCLITGCEKSNQNNQSIRQVIKKYDINPLTTAIAKKAESMGGYNHANMVRAAEDTVTVPDTNKTTEGFRGDPTTQYGGWH